MQYIYADIHIHPFSEAACDILSASLGEIGYDSFEHTPTGINAYISEENFNDADLQDVFDHFFIPDTSFTFSIKRLENKNWNEDWEKNSFDPILEREFGIKLNPRMAFGSGSHETTYQITSLLLGNDFTSQRVLDMGTGTGVLGIAMAMKGAKEVVAIDIDEFSVENAKENFALNSINNAKIILGDATSISGQFSTIVANIHKNIIKKDLPIYVEHLQPNGTIIISGFYTKEIAEMEKAAAIYKLTVKKTTQKNDWAVMELCLNS